MTLTTPGQDRRREQAALTRERMLDAAEELFGRNGYRETNLRQVAEVLGISVGALYLHVAGKEELLRAIIDRRSIVLTSLIRSFVEADGPGIDRLTGLARAEVGFYRAHPAFGRLMGRLFSAGFLTMPQLGADIAVGYTAVMQLQAELVRRGQLDGSVRTGDRESLARLLAAMVGYYRADELARPSDTILAEADFVDMVHRAFAVM